MAKIHEIKNNDTGEVIFPKTHQKAVYDSKGQTLDEVLEELKKSIEEIGGSIFKYSLTATLSKTTFEYTGSEHTGTLTYSVKYKGAEVDPSTFSSFSITPTSMTITESGDWWKTKKSVSFSIPASDSDGYSSHSVKITVIVNGQTLTASASASQLSKIYLNWTTSDIPSSDIFSGDNMKSELKTSLNSTYTWDNIGIGNYLWIAIPTGLSYTPKANSGGYAVGLSKVESDVAYNGISYKYYRTQAAIIASGAGKQSITIN